MIRFLSLPRTMRLTLMRQLMSLLRLPSGMKWGPDLLCSINHSIDASLCLAMSLGVHMCSQRRSYTVERCRCRFVACLILRSHVSQILMSMFAARNTCIFWMRAARGAHRRHRVFRLLSVRMDSASGARLDYRGRFVRCDC